MAKEVVEIEEAKLGECPFPPSPFSTGPKLSLSSPNFTLPLLAFLGMLIIPPQRAHSQVLISEVLASNQSFDRDNYGESSDWLELYNPSATPVDLVDWTLSDDPDILEKWWIPNIILSPGDSVRIWCSGRNEWRLKRELHTNFKLSAQGERLFLTRPEETTPADIFDYTTLPQIPNVSVGLSGESYPISLLGDDALGTYFLPIKHSVPIDWQQPHFDDSQWKRGQSPMGIDRQFNPTHAPEIRTDLSMLMSSDTSKAYFRFPFHYSGTPTNTHPQLSLRFRDGMNAYLNGKRIARRGVLKGGPWKPTAERFIPESSIGKVHHLVLDDIEEHLRTGPNLLAVELAFVEGTSVDFHIAPLIRLVSNTHPREKKLTYLPSPSPGRPNEVGYSRVAPRPQFSLKSGSYRGSQTVSLNLPDQQSGEIFYTLDGSAPSQETINYSKPIRLTSSTRIRAQTFQPQALPSPETSRTYSIVESAPQSFDSNLPIVVIDTHSSEIKPNLYQAMTIQIFTPDDTGRTRLAKTPEFSGIGGIKLRGSSTLNRPKKGYRLELWDDDGNDQNHSLLGMPGDADWILYGPYNYNKTLINNVLVYELSRQMGYYAPRTRFVEAFINDRKGPLDMTTYVGLYVLMERIERSPHRVNIKKVGRGGDAITGGYIFKIDRPGPDEQGFRAGMQDLIHVEPNEGKIHMAQSQWLVNFLNRFFKSLAGPNFTDPNTGYAAYIDVDSWIDQRILQEATRNPDAYSLSTYFTKPRGKKLQAGPAWDFDRAFYFGADLAERGYYELWMNWTEELGYNWGKLMMDDAAFRQRFRARGLKWINDVWSVPNVHALIDNITAEIAEAQQRNHQRWGHLSPDQWREWVGYQKRYIAARINWLRNRFLPPPTLTPQAGVLSPPCEIKLATDYPGATIFYTLDGDGPVTFRGEKAKDAKPYEYPIRLNENQTLTAAIQVGENWSDTTSCSCLTDELPLAITEIMYHPQDGTDLEFIEFQNIGSQRISMDGIEVVEGVDFDFSESSINTLGPDELVLIVKNRDAFEKAFDTSNMTIAGEYEDRLSDTSSRILVLGPAGEKVVDVFYADAWYPETDSLGHSLNLVAPKTTSRALWRDPRRWRPSDQPGGTPGTAAPIPSIWY